MMTIVVHNQRNTFIFTSENGKLEFGNPSAQNEPHLKFFYKADLGAVISCVDSDYPASILASEVGPSPLNGNVGLHYGLDRYINCFVHYVPNSEGQIDLSFRDSNKTFSLSFISGLKKLNRRI